MKNGGIRRWLVAVSRGVFASLVVNHDGFFIITRSQSIEACVSSSQLIVIAERDSHQRLNPTLYTPDIQNIIILTLENQKYNSELGV